MQPSSPPVPTAFEWWAEIWLPSGVGILTLAVTVVSVIIAVRAIGIANRANMLTERQYADGKRAERELAAVELNELLSRMVKSWVAGKPNNSILSGLITESLGITNRFRVRLNAPAYRLADQLNIWHLLVAGQQGDWPAQERRVDFVLAVHDEWKIAIEQYVVDESEFYRMPWSEIELSS